MRLTSLIALALSLLLAACGGSSPAPQPSDPTKDFPGDHLIGDAAVYRIISGADSSGATALEIDPVDGVSGLSNPVPVTGATILYPDQSTQTTSSDGTFDASHSSYAAAHPEALDGNDVQVTIEPPAGSSLHAISATVFAPSSNSEGMIESGTIIEPNDQTASASRVVPQSSIYHCYNYERGVDRRTFGLFVDFNDKVHDVRQMEVTFSSLALHEWFTAHINPCGASEANVRVREMTWRWARPEDGATGVFWTIWIDIINANTKDAITVDGVVVDPKTNFFTQTRNIELICPYYFRPSSLPPTQQAGCI